MSIRRIVWLSVILSFLILYFPINRLASGGWALSSTVDGLIPFYAPAIVPYILGTLLFVGFPIWAAICLEKTQFEAYAISILFAATVSYIVYILFPTYVIRPEIMPQDCFSKAIVILYQNDYPYNAAPSSHTFYTLISFLYIKHWKPKLQLVSLILAILIIASTMLTKQHYLLDVVTGLALGFLAYGAGRYIQKRRNLATTA